MSLNVPLRMASRMLRNVLYLFSGNLLSALLNLLMGYLILRYLSAEEYGRYGVVVDLLNMLALVFGSLFVNALQRYVAMYRAARDYKKASGMLTVALTYAAVVSAMVFLPAFLFPETVARYLLRDMGYAPFVRLYSLAVPFIILSAYLSSFMKGMGMFARVGVFDLTLPTVVRAAVLVVGLPAFPGYGPQVATLSSVSKFLSNFLLNSFASFKAALGLLGHSEKEYELKEWLRYSVFVWGRYALSILSANVKSVLVGSIKGATQGGVFKVAFLVLSPVYMLETSLVNVLFTRLSRAMGKGEDVGGDVRRYSFYIVGAEILFGVLLIAIGPYVLRFFGKGYDAASPLLVLVLLAYVINAASSVHKVFLLSIGRSDLILLIHGINALVSLLGGFFLIRWFGTVGGVYAFVLEGTAGTLVAFLFYRLQTDRSPIDKKTAATLVLSVAAAVVYYTLTAG